MASVIPGIDHCFVVHENSDMASVIKEIDAADVILFAVIPSSDVSALSTDNYHEIDSVFCFVVKKNDRGNLTHEEFLDNLNSTQLIMVSLKHKLIEMAADTEHLTPYSHMLHELMLSTMHTDPEYNLLGCDGWSLSFKLKTEGV